MRPEYDFSQAKPNHYAARLLKGRHERAHTAACTRAWLDGDEGSCRCPPAASLPPEEPTRCICGAPKPDCSCDFGNFGPDEEPPQ